MEQGKERLKRPIKDFKEGVSQAKEKRNQASKQRSMAHRQTVAQKRTEMEQKRQAQPTSQYTANKIDRPHMEKQTPNKRGQNSHL